MGYEATSRLCQAGMLHYLFALVGGAETTQRMLTAGLRALVKILRSTGGVVEIPEEVERMFVRILRRSHEEGFTMEGYEQATLVGELVALSGKQREQQERWGGGGVMDVLVEIVLRQREGIRENTQEYVYDRKLLEAALQALSSLTQHHPAHAARMVAAQRGVTGHGAGETHPMVEKLLRWVKDPSTSIRLGALGCLANMYRSGVIPKQYTVELEWTVIPVLVRLLDEPDRIKECALLILGINGT